MVTINPIISTIILNVKYLSMPIEGQRLSYGIKSIQLYILHNIPLLSLKTQTHYSKWVEEDGRV